MEMETILLICETLFGGSLKAMAADVQARLDGKAHTFRLAGDPAEVLETIQQAMGAEARYNARLALAVR